MQDEPSSSEGASALGMFAAEPPVLTDGAGRFAVSGLREGTYRVTAEAAGGGQRVSQDAVAVGADVTLELESLTGISGRLAEGAAPVSAYTLTSRVRRPDRSASTTTRASSHCRGSTRERIP